MFKTNSTINETCVNYLKCIKTAEKYFFRGSEKMNELREKKQRQKKYAAYLMRMRYE